MVRTRRRSPSGDGVRAAGGGVLAVLLLAAALPAAFAAPAGDAPSPGRGPATELLSAAVDGGPADGASGSPVISADGRVAAFTSAATNLVRGDDNGRSDLFVRDLRGGGLQRVVDPRGEIRSPALSANGRYVAYGRSDGSHSAVIVHDLRTGRSERADVDLAPEHADGHTPAVSADGRTVAFAVHGTGPGPEGADAVYVRDLRARHTERVRVPAGPDDGFRSFRAPSLSADGTKVAYQYVHGDPPRGDWSDLYVHDRDTGRTTQADTTHDGTPATGAATNPLLSADGSTLAFDSAARNLVPGPDPNDSGNPFVRDLRSGAIRRVDAKAPGPEGVVTVDGVSAHGTKLLLDTYPVLTTEDAEHIRDLRTDTDVLVSPDKDGRPADAVDARMDSRARTVVFAGSDQEDFVPDDTNGVMDVFVWRNGGSKKPW
ncbi:PD40 domain-containing protein [Streptomyces sp. A1499]|uniref:PD40 domain-containing protein n=1 Tax=Streptomyces sp. A1499 TaxID=2563104 RepID=UPI00109E4E99|nr:PD40 domain-containing protein [Streptomyces sp. A1499]THC51940.1 hypothetical protein E7X58_13190 [Streptomyces sp. A1499]